MNTIVHELWAWLVTGSNAAAVQAVTAIAGLLGLTIYTTFTGRMMMLNLETRRGDIYPNFFVKQASKVGDATPFFVVTNIGSTAAHLQLWSMPAPPNLNFENADYDRPDGADYEYLGILGPNQDHRVVIPESHQASPHLYFFDCRNAIDGKHQFSVLRQPNPAGYTDFEAKMRNPMDVESIRNRFRRFCKRRFGH